VISYLKFTLLNLNTSESIFSRKCLSFQGSGALYKVKLCLEFFTHRLKVLFVDVNSYFTRNSLNFIEIQLSPFKTKVFKIYIF
jgi:hypothetical protein